MNQVQLAWQDRTLVRWMATQWCNYGCSYCQQNHARRAYYKGSPSHWADNKPWQEWSAAFLRHFSGDITMHMTGGEPLLDKKNAEPLLQRLIGAGWIASIDTNGSFPCQGWELDKSAIGLQVSYHPEEVEEEQWFVYMQKLLDNGWRVDMAAYVTVPGTLPTALRIAERLHRLGVPVNTHPLNFTAAQYTEEEIATIRSFLPEKDLAYRVGKSTGGNPCLYPAISYEVDPDGSVIVSCHRHLGEQYHGSVWDAALPVRPRGYVACPRSKCDCEERYTFQEHLGYNVQRSPKAEYASRLKELQLCG